MASRAARLGAWYGIGAALTFGASAPVARTLFDRDADPQLLAGTLDASAALALTLAAIGRRRHAEAPLGRADLPRLTVVTAACAIAAPVLLLDRVSGLCGSLLLNLEAPLTAMLAVVVFGQHLSRREMAAGSLVVTIGSVTSDADAFHCQQVSARRDGWRKPRLPTTSLTPVRAGTGLLDLGGAGSGEALRTAAEVFVDRGGGQIRTLFVADRRVATGP